MPASREPVPSPPFGAEPVPLHPLKTQPSPAVNLPRPLTFFIGRERAIGLVVDRLRRDDVRLLTLRGGRRDREGPERRRIDGMRQSLLLRS